jgi:hypothetical protein
VETFWLARNVPGGRIRPGAGAGNASAEDLAGDSRSEFQRYLILLREWPLRQFGEDHRVPLETMLARLAGWASPYVVFVPR